MEGPQLIRLDSENVIAFLEDYDQERILLLSETGTKESAEFEKNFQRAMRSQRTDVVYALLSGDVDEYALVLDELDLKKEDLPAICYMGIGEDLNVRPLSDTNVGYLESVLKSLLEPEPESDLESESGDSVDNEEQLLKTILSSLMKEQEKTEKENQ